MPSCSKYERKSSELGFILDDQHGDRHRNASIPTFSTWGRRWCGHPRSRARRRRSIRFTTAYRWKSERLSPLSPRGYQPRRDMGEDYSHRHDPCVALDPTSRLGPVPSVPVRSDPATIGAAARWLRERHREQTCPRPDRSRSPPLPGEASRAGSRSPRAHGLQQLGDPKTPLAVAPAMEVTTVSRRRMWVRFRRGTARTSEGSRRRRGLRSPTDRHVFGVRPMAKAFGLRVECHRVDRGGGHRRPFRSAASIAEVACASSGWAPHARITSRSENHQDPPTAGAGEAKPRRPPMQTSGRPAQATIERPTAPSDTKFRTVSRSPASSRWSRSNRFQDPADPGRGRDRSRRRGGRGVERGAAVILEWVPPDFRLEMNRCSQRGH